MAIQKSSSHSDRVIDTLKLTLRAPFVPLYTAFPGPALDLALALFVSISNDQISKLDKKRRKLRELWESVQNAILSGILVIG